MSSLDRKLFRDLWQVRGQALAIAAVMACGIAIYVMAMIAMESLQYSQRVYYDRYHFADVFTGLKRAPLPLRHRLSEIPGVREVSTRIVKDVTLSVEGLSEPAVGRLITLPDRPREGLNLVHLRLGRFPESDEMDEVLVSEGFANAHGMGPGDHVTAILNGRLRELHIVGVALSPEYVYLIRPGDLIPDPSRFGIFWMSKKALEAAFDMEGAFNDGSLALMPAANSSEVIARVDELTEPYGGFGAYLRYDQMSNRFLSDEITNLRSVGLLIPSLFLLVSAFLLNLVVGRIVGVQREQIAALKALGYTNGSVGLHYLKFALGIVSVGWLIGTLGGMYLGYNMTLMYTQFFNFPILSFHMPMWIIVSAAGVASGAGIVGTVGSVRRAVVLPPAEAMRPEPPAEYRPTILERMGMTRLLSNTTLMILRNLERTPVKSLLSVLGIAMAAGILVIGRCTADGIFYMIDVVFEIQQRQDMMVTFVEPRSSRAIQEISHLPGVLGAEPFRSVPARIRHGHRHRRTGVMGLARDAELFQLLDAQVQKVEVPEGGLLLSEKMGQMLGARTGDTVILEVLEGSRPVREVKVTGMVNEFLGSTPYMDLDALNDLMDEGRSVSGAHLVADAKYVDELYQTLKTTPGVAGVTIKEAAVSNFKKTLAETLLIMVTFQTAFSMIIAFGVVYNAARIAVSERGRELASLRVLGFTRGEISSILLGELAILTLVAIPLGLVAGYFASYGIVQSFDTDLFRLPFHLESSTYARAVVIVTIASLISGLIVRRKLDHLDLIAVLKTKE